MLGVHLMLVWSWRIAHPPAAGHGEERVLDLIPIPPPAPRPRLEEPVPQPAPSFSAAPRARRLPDQPVAPEPVGPQPQAAIPVADPFAITESAAPDGSPLEAMVGRARRDAGVIDRELRKGKSGVPALADTPWGRFTRALEDAHKETRRTLVSETYTAPDGQVIYRFRQGGKVWCRTGGGVKPVIGGAEGGGATLFDRQGGEGGAGTIRCPSHGDWKRD